MERVTITAKGEVQGVNYRKAVQEIARKLDIVGFVENTKPYDVRIVAEGETEVLEKFMEEIQIKKPPIIVEDVDVKHEESTGEFEYFEIKRGDMVDELGERMDVAGGVMYEIRDLQDESRDLQKEALQKQDQMLEKQDKTIERFDSFHQDTVQRFDNLDTKYGRIADIMEKIMEEMKEERKEYRKSTERLITTMVSQKSER